MEEQANKSQEMDLGGEETNASAPLPEEKLVEESELEKLKAELESYKDKYIRTIAEFDNFKRRNAKERIELMQTAGRDVITELLDVVDDCDRAQQTLEKAGVAESAAWEGVKLVFNKLKSNSPFTIDVRRTTL